MFSGILIALGIVIALSTMLIGIYFVNLGCAMATQGCEQSILELLVELMTAPEGAMLWAGAAIGFVLIWVGYNIKSYSGRTR